MATEKRLIDANALLREVMEGHPYEGLSMAAQVCTMELLTYAPTVDAVEVVHGHWEKTIDNCTVMHKCSVCGARVVKGFYEYENPNRYCYHCGAKMDGDKDSYGYNADKCDTVTYKGVKLPMPPKMDGERKDND